MAGQPTLTGKLPSQPTWSKWARRVNIMNKYRLNVELDKLRRLSTILRDMTEPMNIISALRDIENQKRLIARLR